jgi:hypothetical protein
VSLQGAHVDFLEAEAAQSVLDPQRSRLFRVALPASAFDADDLAQFGAALSLVNVEVCDCAYRSPRAQLDDSYLVMRIRQKGRDIELLGGGAGEQKMPSVLIRHPAFEKWHIVLRVG